MNEAEMHTVLKQLPYLERLRKRIRTWDPFNLLAGPFDDQWLTTHLSHSKIHIGVKRLYPRVPHSWRRVMVRLCKRGQQLSDHIVIHEVALIGDEVQPVERLDVVPVLIAEHGQDVDITELRLLPTSACFNTNFMQFVKYKVGFAHHKQVQQINQDDEVHGAEQSDVYCCHDALQLHSRQLTVDPELQLCVAANVWGLTQRTGELILPLTGIVGAQVGNGDGTEADNGQVACQVKLSQKVTLASSLQIFLKQVLLRAFLLLCVLYDLPPLPLSYARPFGLDLLLDLWSSALSGSMIAVINLLKQEIEL